jgi:hypothetical protein
MAVSIPTFRSSVDPTLSENQLRTDAYTWQDTDDISLLFSEIGSDVPPEHLDRCLLDKYRLSARKRGVVDVS